MTSPPRVAPAVRALALAAALPAVAAPCLAQEAPPEFTTYRIVGPEGFGAPPVHLRIEPDRIESPPTGGVVVESSRVDGTRVWLDLDTRIGPMRFLGCRIEERLAGRLYSSGDQGRWMVEASLVPWDEEPAPAGPCPESPSSGHEIEVVPEEAAIGSGASRRFVARVFEAPGVEVRDVSVEWYVQGAAHASVDADGVVTGSREGTARVVALAGDGSWGSATVTVAAPRIERLRVVPEVPERLAAGSRVTLEVRALDALGHWDFDPMARIVSSAPATLAVEGRTLRARAPGQATVTVRVGEARAMREVVVVAAEGDLAITGSPREPVRTGDVVRLGVTIPGARPVWAAAGPGARVDPDGAFVAERAGDHVVVAVVGEAAATTTVTARPRDRPGRIRVLGHAPSPDAFTSDLWPQGGFVYAGTHQANELRTWDVRDPAVPVQTDRQTFDARVINDVKASRDGRWLVATREGAADRRNGILVFSLEDPARPRLVSEYTETLTAGVHNVFWNDTLLYAVNDGTGDLHVLDLGDPARPREIARWGLDVKGRSLHDVWVQDGVAYLSYLEHGLAMLDVGGGGRGGTPADPVPMGRIVYPGGPTHSAMRYRDYLFVGDEDLSLRGTTPSALGAEARGPIHVIDVSDPEAPREVARYEVPEAGAHNFWVHDGVLYVAHTQGGIRVVDVEGELRGDLYAQGREIAHYLPVAGPGEAKRPWAASTWGVFPMFGDGWAPEKGPIYVSDRNSGVWVLEVDLDEGRP